MQRQSVTRVGVVANTPYRFIRCFLIYLQWRRQAWGTRARAPPWSLMHAVFFLLSQAFCGLKYAENAIVAEAPPRTSLGGGSSRRSTRPPSRLRSGDPSPYPTPLGASMLAPSAPRSLCPLTPNPGDATVYLFRQKTAQSNQIRL